MTIWKEEKQFNTAALGYFNISQSVTLSKRHSEIEDDFTEIKIERIQKELDKVNLSISVPACKRKELYEFFTDLKSRSFDCFIHFYNLEECNISIISDISYSSTGANFEVSFTCIVNYVK